MPTAVVELELKGRSDVLRVPGKYAKAMVLLRWAGRPVGRLYLPVEDGAIASDVLESDIARYLTHDFYVSWLHDSLGWDESGTRNLHHTATVAVCTRNRPHELKNCLHALMALPDGGQEVLVVDNNPPDGATREVVRKFPQVRYVQELGGGLNAARNRAIREASGEVVAFTDDDAVVDPGWLQATLRNFDDPRVLCVTGLTMPLELETEAQELFERYSPFCRGFKRRIFDIHRVSPLGVGGVGSGANNSFRKSVIDLVGDFDEALDCGTPTRSGGDHEMYSRILAAGYRIVYDPAALNWHRHRRTMRELEHTLEGYGVGVYAFWTRALLRNHEFSVFKHAYRWLRQSQLPDLFKSLRRQTRRAPARLPLAELRGCLAGPRAYVVSSRSVQKARDRRQHGLVADRSYAQPPTVAPADFECDRCAELPARTL